MDNNCYAAMLSWGPPGENVFSCTNTVTSLLTLSVGRYVKEANKGLSRDVNENDSPVITCRIISNNHLVEFNITVQFQVRT